MPDKRVNVLVIGGGGREHAIAWKLRQSRLLGELYVAPGNAGTAQVAKNVAVAADDVDGLLRLAAENGVDFTIVGPEGPLEKGIVDVFQTAGRVVFGPSQAAARIETSKAFTKGLMLRHGVPTAKAAIFTSLPIALRYVEQAALPVVVKADGLAAGKGVVVARSINEAAEAVRDCLERRVFGAAGDTVLVEECLSGREVSVFAFVDGERVSAMVAARDYKRAHDGDTGPNTGGMGSFSPPPEWDAPLEERVRRQVMEPVVRGMAAEGYPFRGLLYAGLMLTADGPMVLEFNCRFGDPETQAVLPRLKSDLLATMMATAQGDLEGVAIQWDRHACVGVVVASGSYPGLYNTGHPIHGLDAVDKDALVFHAGTRLAANGRTVETSGGRVLTVAALGHSVADARRKAYNNVARVHFESAFYRRDIAAGV